MIVVYKLCNVMLTQMGLVCVLVCACCVCVCVCVHVCMACVCACGAHVCDVCGIDACII